MYDGLDAPALAARLGVPRVALFDSTTSTMDEAAALAAGGTPAGTVVLADAQTAGRGRSGAGWIGAPGASILCTIVERPPASDALGVLSLRAGLLVAAALDEFAAVPVGVKWPNDLLVGTAKVAGVLVESRWRGQHLDWAGVGIGINVGLAPAGLPGSGCLRPGVARLAVLCAVVPALRRAAARSGALSAEECHEWRRRDALAGTRVRAPARGVVRGILPTGELVVDTPEGEAIVRSGSVMREDS